MPLSLQEESIFYAALQLADGEARAAYLSSACDGDTGLRQRVERLLAAHGAGEFLEHPGGDLGATALHPFVSERPGTTIGPYKLLEQIGEGGMGLVFMAEQSRPLRRRVAMKIIKPGLDTRAVIARFEAERQALALMDHPNIARVFDAGATESGRPYFIMELVRGAPITDYCRERGVGLRERLELFIDVCDAVQHAHQKGVIHRDLKPTNILVSQNDTSPVPKVIDFGVAKATASQTLTDKTLFTAFTQIIGTPLYMSPEQADVGNQDVDTRSDVYSLGVVLYELLTGTTPFAAERLRSVSHDEMRRIIREEEPQKPSTRATTAASASLSTVAAASATSRIIDIAALKGELDWIVMKALEKDRRRRYESPGAFAADIERYFAGLPVLAHSGRFWYRTRKYISRHWVAMLSSAAVVLSLLVGIAVALSGWRREETLNTELVSLLSERDRAFREANDARKLAEVERNRASEAYTELADRTAFQADARGDVSEAALWFAHAASQRADSMDHRLRDESKLRAAAWLAASVRPVAAFKHVGAIPVHLTLTDDGHFLWVIDASGKHSIWDVHKQRAVDLKIGGTSIAALSDNGVLCAHTSVDDQVEVYECSNMSRVARIAVDGLVSAMTFSHDAHYLAIAASKLQVWDCRTRRLLDGPDGTAASISYLAFDPSSTSLLVHEADGGIFVMQIQDGQVERSSARFGAKHVLDTHSWGESPVMPMITADSVIVRTGQNALEAYSLASGSLIWQCPARWRIGSVSQNRRGGSIVLTGKEAQIWQVGDSTPIRTIVGHQDTILATALSSDGDRLITGGMDSEANVWRPMQEYMLRTRVYHEGHVTAVAIAEDRDKLFATAQDDGLIRVWKTAFPTPYRTIALDAQSQLIVSPDGRHIMTGGSLYWERKLRAARVFDAVTGQSAGPSLRPGGLINGTTFSPDGARVVTLSTLPKNAGLTSYEEIDWENKPGLVTVWNWRTGEREVEWSTPSEPVDAEYLPTGAQMVVVCAGGEVLVADSDTGDVLRSLDHGAHATLMWTTPKRRIVVAPHGDFLATAGLGDVVKVWRVRDGRLLCSAPHGDRVRDAKFSPDGQWLVTASMDKTARVWDCRSGKELARLQHSDWVLSATFNEDGTRVLTASRDQTARLWNWGNGSEELVLPHQDAVADAAFASAGEIIATITEDGHACFWSPRTGKLIAPPARGSYWGHSLAVTGGGLYVVIGTGEREVPVFDVHRIPDLRRSHDRASVEELEVVAELLSGRRLENGETIGLTSDEWLERWKETDQALIQRLMDAEKQSGDQGRD